MNKENAPKVSIIIPIYNTENYLKQCLNSVINQTLKDIEIILIDDGSTDNSPKICDEYKEKDKRIKVFHQEHIGISVARNVGLNIATGEYIGFVDSDDEIDLDFYEKLYTKAIETNSDVVKGNVKIIDYKKNISKSTLNYRLIVTKNKWYFHYEWWSAIYRTQLIKENNIKFPEEIIYGEDCLFLHYIIEKTNKFETINDTNYYYKRRENSEDSPILSDEKINSALFVHEKTIKNFNKVYEYKNFDKECYLYLCGTKIQVAINLFFRANTDKSKRKCIEYLVNFYNICLEKEFFKKEICKYSINSKLIVESKIDSIYKILIKYKNYDELVLSNNNKIIYIIYIVLLKLGIKDIVKKILQKLGFKFQE